MEPLPATFYGKIDKKNPVISAFENEIKEFMGFMKRISPSVNWDYESYTKGSKTLFEIWNKYKPRLPSYYYEDNLLLVADFLSRIKLHRMALWQGYSRYLLQFSSFNPDDITDVNQFKSIFFPQGLETDSASRTFRALQGYCVCSFHLEWESELPQTQASVQRLLRILDFLRLIMQAVLPQESLCWLLYNGSIYIYTICRHLMALGHSAQALEYLLWASVCLEMSVPLLTVGYLSWRATLYSAVCQCYYDCQAGLQAEVFARRSLGKVNELSELQERSMAPQSPKARTAFLEATVKMAVMVFKRAVYEPRRKPKALFRPKQKSNLKEVQNMPWPRTPSEKLLMEMFDGSAAQFLALQEALWDSSRRPLHTGPSEEHELQEVSLELLSAGISILAGGGGSGERRGLDMNLPQPISGIRLSPSLLQLAVSGESGVSVEGAVRFVKLLFRYEQWEMFSSLSALLLPLLQGLSAPVWRTAELDLKLLVAMEPLLTAHRHKHAPRESVVLGEGVTERERLAGPVVWSDDLLNLVETLYACVCLPEQGQQPDGDLVLDVVLFLWMKCKTVFQRVQAGYADSFRYLHKLDNHEKWVCVLWLLSEVAQVCNLGQTDPATLAELSLRLAAVLENSADSALKSGRMAGKGQDSSEGARPDPSEGLNILKRPPVQQLWTAYEVVDRAVEGVSQGRMGAITDITRLQDCARKASDCSSSAVRSVCTLSPLQLFCMDLHLELLTVQHRIGIKLCSASPDTQPAYSKNIKSVASSIAVDTSSHNNSAVSEAALLDRIKKNKISRALFLMQKALHSPRKDQLSFANKKLLEEAMCLIEKAEVEEKKLFNANNLQERRQEGTSRATPPPVLLSRTQHSMTFVPVPFSPAQQSKVCWYHIFGRAATGSNPKVRLSDCHLPGCGEEVPAMGECVLQVTGLEPNEKYIFAVAAYDANGAVIGDAIGESTRPLLASAPLPLLTAWAHLAQAAYQTGHYALAKRASRVLWEHFTRPGAPTSEGLPEPGPGTKEAPTQARLCSEAVSQASPVLLQLFLSTIFMQADIHIQEGALFCDSLCDGGPLIWGQLSRLAECERVLVALDLALWLNDNSAALQAVVECYGLLAPIIYHRIPSEAVIQVLLKCLAVLQEIPVAFRQKRPASAAESLQHMVACISYYLAKVLRSRQEYCLASAVIDWGKKLLQESTDSGGTASGPQNKLPAADQEGAQVERAQRRLAVGQSEEDTSEQLKALESILHQDPNTWKRGALELTGQEEPTVLYSVIATYPLKSAYREVLKFKRKARFLEFVAQLLQRALFKDRLDLVLLWGQEINHWLNRRDEALTGIREGVASESRGPGGGAEQVRRYTAAVTEYSKKGKPGPDSTHPEKKRKAHPQHRQLLKGQSTVRGSQAVDRLLTLLEPMVRDFQRRRQLRQLCSDEWSWRCQLNATMALAYFTTVRRMLETRFIPGTDSYRQLNPVLFSLPFSGTLVRWRSVVPGSRAPEPPLPSRPGPCTAPPGKPASCSRDVLGVSGGESTESEGESEQDTPRTQKTNDSDSSTQASQTKAAHRSVSQAQLLDSLSKAMLHFRRAMVLAHRGGHWACLQWVCRMLWDQASVADQLLGWAAPIPEQSCPLSLEHLHATLTPVLLLASHCLLDMIQRLQEPPATLQVWGTAGALGGDEGDSSLHFSSPLDDGTVVSLRCVSTLTLRTLELLHLQGRWESLAHLAILFNSITNERYTHLVTPLLVYAQRRLLERVHQFGGPQPPQPHFTRAEEISGERITCRNFIGHQLVIGSAGKEEVHPGSYIDPKGHDIYSGGRRAMVLVSVPLDVADTLCCFRKTMDRGHYHSRALQHSRSLLWLLLAHTQHGGDTQCSRGSTSQSHGRLVFNIAASSAPAASPPDLSAEDFSSLSALYSSTLPHSQLPTVVMSYTNTIEFLQANNQDSLTVQALHELGNLYFYSGNKRAAHSCWSKALDSALCQPGVLGSWDGGGEGSNLPQIFLRKAGIWGCLQGAVLSAKIAQYTLTCAISQQTHCCILSALLFKALLWGSLPHPLLDWEYCSYSLGLAWDIPELLPGVELFSEPHRAQVGTTVSSLAFVCQRLYSAGHSLLVLPLLSLYLYFVSTVCRDQRRTIEGRIMKVQALTELCLFAEAMRELGSLLQGERIPQPHGNYCPTNKCLTKNKFDTSKPLLDSANLQTLEELVNRPLTPELSALYGPRLVKRLTLAKTQLVIALCDTVHGYPESPAQDSKEQRSNEGTQRSSPALPGSPSSEWGEAGSCTPSRKTRQPRGLQLDLQRERLTPGRLKSLLLGESSRTLTTLIDGLQPAGGSAVELEMAVEARLLLSAVSVQQGRANTSARLALSALRLLQESPLFQDQSPTPSQPNISPALRQPGHKRGQVSTGEAEAQGSEGGGGSLPNEVPHIAETRERLGASLWLRCRLAAGRALAAHIPGLAVHKGVESSGDRARLLREGLEETQAWGDPDTRAQLLLQAALLETHKGRQREEVTPLLQEAVGLLSSRLWLSPVSALTLARATLHLSDMRGRGGDGGHSLYSLTQKLLQQQLSALGEDVELGQGGVVLFHQSAGPKNMYLPHTPLLAKATLRLGYGLAQQAARCPDTDSGPWAEAQCVLDLALRLCRAAASRDGELESDILYCKGVVERKLVSLGECGPQAALNSLLEAVSVTRSHNNNLLLVRRCYLEMALLYLEQWASMPPSPQGQENPEEVLPAALSTTPTPPAKPREGRQKGPGWRQAQTPNDRSLSAGQVQLLLSWVCVRAATQVSEASVHCVQLSSSTGAKTGPLPLSSMRSLPEFAANDLLSSFSPIPSEGREELLRSQLSPFIEAESSEAGQAGPELTWVHLTRYHSHLLNLYSIANRPVECGCADSSYSQAVDGDLALRLTQLHRFFISKLPTYREHCCPPDPPTALLQPSKSRLDQASEPGLDGGLGLGDSFTIAAADSELCVQWHCPALDPGHAQKMTLLVFAYNSKPLSASRPSAASLSELRCGHRWISLNRLQSVHSQLSSLCVSADLSSLPAASPPSPQAEKRRRSQGQPWDLLIQEQARQCCSQVQSLLLDLPEPEELTEVPFELSLQALCDLEHCFNPASGCVLPGGDVLNWLSSLLH
ncbi:cilia- and flagella-associated protein 54 isoform X1 [Amia ocellicauda]|uniref:cilia- and flagella-associated protein 54 isoform X1 n=1 Tax=Amia ocellicauda TaxID=2972642 RepID=UPI0034645F59